MELLDGIVVFWLLLLCFVHVCVYLCSSLKEIPFCFSTMAAPLCIPTKSMQAFQFSYILSKFVVFLIIAILKDIR